MALDLNVWELLGVSLLIVIASLLVAYGIAGWYERRARRRRDAKLAAKRRAKMELS